MKVGKKKSFVALFAQLCFAGHDGMKTAPSGRNFKLVMRKLARSAECTGLVRANNSTVLIDKDTFPLDESIESSQVTTVLTFHVEEYLGIGGVGCKHLSRYVLIEDADQQVFPQCAHAQKR